MYDDIVNVITAIIATIETNVWGNIPREYPVAIMINENSLICANEMPVKKDGLALKPMIDIKNQIINGLQINTNKDSKIIGHIRYLIPVKTICIPSVTKKIVAKKSLNDFILEAISIW